jgi:hypothetical protein
VRSCAVRFTDVKLQALRLYPRNATPDSVACDISHPDSVAPHSTALVRLARERLALVRLAPEK